MRLLVDANLSFRVAQALGKAGHDASHVADHGLMAATDEAILLFAREGEHVIVSADSDFATLLALGGADTPSLVLLRSADHLTPAEQATLLIDNLPTIEAELAEQIAGGVASLSPTRLRFRPLPMRS